MVTMKRVTLASALFAAFALVGLSALLSVPVQSSNLVSASSQPAISPEELMRSAGPMSETEVENYI